MKIQVSIRKIRQEIQYEPFAVELSLTQEVEEKTSEEVLRKKFRHISNLLQEEIEDIMAERLKER